RQCGIRLTLTNINTNRICGASSLKGLYAFRIGYYDAGVLQSSTPFRTFTQILPKKSETIIWL
ncbi:hypothetical protein ACV4SB_004067, partial [Shigella flexneri]